MARRCSTCSRRISPKTAALYRGHCAICHLKKPPPRFNGPGSFCYLFPGRSPLPSSTPSRPRLCLVVPVAPVACSEPFYRVVPAGMTLYPSRRKSCKSETRMKSLRPRSAPAS